MQIFQFILLALLFFTSSVCLLAHETPADNESTPLHVELIPENETLQPGQTFWVAIQLKLENGWHAYWKNPGDSGMAIDIEWQLPPGFIAGETEWPYPQRFDLSSLIGYGYEGEVWLLTPITPPQSLPKDSLIEIGANIDWLVCSEETCLPGSSTAAKNIPVSFSPPVPHNRYVLDFGKARAQMPQKHWHMYAYRKDDQIKLHLQAPEHEGLHYHSAIFFPAHQTLIDHKTPAALHPKTDDLSHYVISLKDVDGSDSKAAFLSGVVVLNSNDPNAVRKALEVHVPIQEKHAADPGPVAMLDTKEKEALKLTLETDSTKAHTSTPTQEFEGGLLLALLFAFLGGLLLNLMPCVLPVVSFKILSFVKLSGQNRWEILKHGIAFSLGVILSFWVLAGVMLILQAYGRSAGWGFQLQEPIFVAVLAAILTLFGLSSMGVFELGLSMSALAGSGQSSSHKGLGSSFFSGILATTVATPCTGPFLGSAIGFAVTLPPFKALLVFTVLGMGMASPYLFLAYYPQWLRYLPKPGEWMVAFKEAMGFLMFATVLWLLWVFGAQTSTLGLILLLCALFFLALGSWIYGKWSPPVYSKKVRTISYVLTLLCLTTSGFIISRSVSPQVIALASLQKSHDNKIWQPFSESKIANLRKKGVPVFVDFTAKWCLICQANHLVLSSPDVEAKFEQLGVVRMKADWTKNDPKITAALKKFGRSGVPLYVLYSSNPEEAPQILPQVLTPDGVLSYLEKISPQMIADKEE